MLFVTQLKLHLFALYKLGAPHPSLLRLNLQINGQLQSLIKLQMITKTQSTGILNLRKQLQNPQPNIKVSPHQCFIPFINQRRLGKIIYSNTKSMQKQRSDKKRRWSEINFKNFQQVYLQEHGIENAKYSHLTRKPNQQDLISIQKDWKINKIGNQTIRNKSSSQRNLSSGLTTTRNQSQLKISPQKFVKADEFVYKKIVVSRPSQKIKNPEIHQIFKHYVQVCQLNENIRRIELTRKQKF